MTIEEQIGTALYETHGALCEELVQAGYDLENYYDGRGEWGDFKRVLVMVSVLRGATNYAEYEAFYRENRGEYDTLASKQLFARLTGIYTPRTDKTQTDRTRTYRLRLREERDKLRELTARAWIEGNLQEAQDFIKTLTEKK